MTSQVLLFERPRIGRVVEDHGNGRGSGVVAAGDHECQGDEAVADVADGADERLVFGSTATPSRRPVHTSLTLTSMPSAYGYTSEKPGGRRPTSDESAGASDSHACSGPGSSSTTNSNSRNTGRTTTFVMLVSLLVSTRALAGATRAG